MAREFRVARGRTICMPDGRLIKSYAQITPEEVHAISPHGPKHFEQLVKDGSVIEVGGESPPVEQPAVLQVDGTLKKNDTEVQRSMPLGKWRHDPEKLKGKNLEQLNVMVLESDDKEEPFTTVAEAVAHLSQNFKK